MGRQLAATLPGARRLYDLAGAILGYDLAQLCFEGPAEDLDSTVYSQPALFVTSLAALESLRAHKPDVPLACEAVAGLSLGEYTLQEWIKDSTAVEGDRDDTDLG